MPDRIYTQPDMSDLDLRKVRYFLAVARQLHFGRAAEELHIAQPVLSRQIRALEKDLGTELFVRDRRRTELTAVGRQLLADAPALLAESDAVQRRVARAARGTRCFAVGFMPGLVVTGPARALQLAHPDLEVKVVRTGWDDQVEVILDGRVDIGFIRLPVDRRGLRVEPLFAEPRMVMLPVSHVLATRREVTLVDLADEHLLQDPNAVPEWRNVATDLRMTGSRWTQPAPRTVEEKLEYVAAGRGISILPASTAAFYRRADVAAVRISDLGPNHVALAWSATRRSRLIAEFSDLARRELPVVE